MYSVWSGLVCPPPQYVCCNMPVGAQMLPVAEELSGDKPVSFNLCECSGCGLVQFDCDPVPYYKDSTRAGERSEAMIALRQRQYAYFIEKYGLSGKKILEVGAGHGGNLRTLKDMKYHVREYGIENNAGFVEEAKEKYEVNIKQDFLDSPNKCIEGAPFDAFMSFAYPARLIKPNVMLRCVHHNLVEGGVGLVMVPSLEHLCQPGGFYDITGDHIAYYSQDTFRFLLNKNGFDVLEQGESSGVYNYAIVRKRERTDFVSIWSDVEMLAKEARQFVIKCTRDGRKLGVWCAGHYAFTVISVAGIGDNISYIMDNAVSKQGHFAPASHVPIVSPEHYREEPVDTILILGPLYIDEIIKEIRETCSMHIDIAVMNGNGIRVLDNNY